MRGATVPQGMMSLRGARGFGISAVVIVWSLGPGVFAFQCFLFLWDVCFGASVAAPQKAQ